MAKIDHGIVLVEVFQPVDLQPEAADLPLDFQRTPVSYFSLNDFLNLARELRTTPELLEYLNARRSLATPDLRAIGDEKSLFEFYLLNNGSLQGCASRADARKAALAQQSQLQRILKSKAESDYYSMLLEHVPNELTTRNPPSALSPAYYNDCCKSCSIDKGRIVGLDPSNLPGITEYLAFLKRHETDFDERYLWD